MVSAAFLLPWALLLTASPAQDCPPPLAPGAPPAVYVLLMGHPGAPARLSLPDLQAVEDDVLRMHGFFGILEPRRSHVHLEASLGMVRMHPEIEFRPATFRSVLDSVDAIAKEIRARGGLRVLRRPR